MADPPATGRGRIAAIAVTAAIAGLSLIGLSPAGGAVRARAASGWWVPPKPLTWYWQLQGTVNNSQPVAAYDIDGFDNSAGEVATLHGQGKHVICYIDVGTAENFRPDYSSFPASVLGQLQRLAGRALARHPPARRARADHDRALSDVQGKGLRRRRAGQHGRLFENSTGFPLTAAEQLSYNEWVAGEVHALGMAVFQKNDGEQTSQLEPHFDGALDEQCNQYHECSDFQPYLAAGKPVLNAEYSLADELVLCRR